VRNVRQRHDRLVGFTYDEAAGVAHFSMYVPGTAGRVRKRATVRAASYDQAVGLWSAFRSRAAEGLRRPSPEAPTFCEFITDYFPSIKASVKEKTASDYRYGIDRHLIPQLGALRLTEITSGVLNRLGSSLMAEGYAGATVNKYMTLAALLLGYAVEFDVIAELPLKKKLKKQKANKPCLELNAEERAAFLAAFNDEPGFRRFLAETMPKAKPRQTKDGRFGSRRAHGAGMREDSDAAHAYFLRFQASRDLFLAALETQASAQAIFGHWRATMLTSRKAGYVLSSRRPRRRSSSYPSRTSAGSLFGARWRIGQSPPTIRSLLPTLVCRTANRPCGATSRSRSVLPDSTGGADSTIFATPSAATSQLPVCRCDSSGR